MKFIFSNNHAIDLEIDGEATHFASVNGITNIATFFQKYTL
jgi:hypothetical protein